jgi:cyclomaltodextrinase / maltogenic alpha-amylase / neopullulanase
MSGPDWLLNTVFYQIFPERFFNGDPSNDPTPIANWNTDQPTRENFFGGDLEGIRQKLPHLRELGASGLYLTPIFAAGSSHKYDTHDYRQIDPTFGTLETFRALVADLKANDIHLLLDAVFNHCGDGFWAFRDVIEQGAASRYLDWFTVQSLPITFDPPSYQTCGGAPFLPKLNVENAEVRAHLLAITETWLHEGIDGWRLDVPWKVGLDFWRAFRQRVLACNPDAYIVAEVWRGVRDWMMGDTVHGVMNYRLRGAILDYTLFDHMDAEDFDYEVGQLHAEFGDATPYQLTLLGSHDTPRILTLSGGNIDRTLCAIALQMTLPGTPMIYYGDEIGMEGDNDPDCRRPMIWDRNRWNDRIWQATRTLVNLRHTHPALRTGAYRPLHIFNGVYAYARISDDDVVMVLLNPRAARCPIRVELGDLAPRATEWADALSDRTYTLDGAAMSLTADPHSVLVLTPLTHNDR